MSRNPFSPYGSDTMVVDKLIGTAYDVVKLVASKLTLLESIGNQVDNIQTVADKITNSHKLTGTVTTLGATASFALPSEVNTDEIESVSVIITGTDGKLYFPSSTTFTYVVDLGYLRITLAASGPAGLVGALYKATVVTAPSED